MGSSYEPQTQPVTHISVQPTALPPSSQPVFRPHRRSIVRSTAVAALTLLVVICLVSFVAGPTVYPTVLYWDYLRDYVASLCGDHIEMIDATYLVVACVLPLLVSVVSVELLRKVRGRSFVPRPRHVWTLSSWLRRRPVIFKWICWFSVGELLFLTALIGGNVVVFWYGFSRRYQLTRLPTDSILPLIRLIGRVLGFNCLFNMVFLFLPATRGCVWMEFLDISYANGVKYHRWLGVAAVLTGVVHCACYYWSWVSLGMWKERALPCWNCSWADREARHSWVNVFGELALLCFLLIAVTSIPVVRRRWFTTFHAVHHLFLASVVFTVLHWGSAAWFLLPTFVAYLATRAIAQRNILGAGSAPVQELEMVGDNICKLVVVSGQGVFEPGQFVYVNVPVVSKLQWHPFTVANSVPRSGSTVLLLKSLGDWSSLVVDHARECVKRNEPPVVHVDGFYGASLRNAATDYSTLVLVGGGVGVTPLLSLLDDLATNPSSAMDQQIHFVLCFRDSELIQVMAPLLRQLRAHDPFVERFRVSLFLTRAAMQPYWTGISAEVEKRTWRQSHHRQTNAGPVERVALTIAVFAVTTLLLVTIEYSNGAELPWFDLSVWVDQRAAQMIALSIGIGVAYVVGIAVRLREAAKAWMFRHYHRLAQTDRLEERLLKPEGVSAWGSSPFDRPNTRDLLDEFAVRQGEHPNLERLLRFDTQRHQSKSPIGVLVSGPGSMKAAVARAVADIGSHRFDVHEEEFEL